MLTRAPPTNGRLPISWSSLVSTMALALALVGGMWGVTQTQFSSMYSIIQENKQASERLLGAIRSDQQRADNDLKTEQQFLRQQFINRRADTVGQDEFKQVLMGFRDRLDRIDRQLQSLEQTRPTTGELQSTARALDAQVNRVEERTRQLENFIRGSPAPAR